MLPFFERSSNSLAINPAGQKSFFRIFLAKFFVVPILNDTNDSGSVGSRFEDINL